MGRFVVLSGTAVCPVDGSAATVEVQVPVVLPPDDAAMEFTVGQSLAPFVVEDVVELLVALCPPPDPERGAALFLWFCPRCREYRAVRADLDTAVVDTADRDTAVVDTAVVDTADRDSADAAAVLVGLTIVTPTAATLEGATWIDPELVRLLLDGTSAQGTVPARGRLDAAQYRALLAAVEGT